MPTETLTEPQNAGLTTLARVKEQIGESGSTNDDLLSALILSMGGVVRGRLGWDVVRGQYKDTFRGTALLLQDLGMVPVVSIDSANLDGDAVTLTDEIEIANPGAGLIRRVSGWTATTRNLWDVTYWGGWLVKDDDVSSAAITFAGTGQTLTLSSGTWPLLAPGDRFTVSGASQSANNRTATVLTRTDTVLTAAVGSGFVDEAEGATVAVAVANLPLDIERATIALVRDAFRKRDQGGSVTSEKVGPLERKFAGPGALDGLISLEAETLLSRWARVPL